jgi:hypothetical protein
MRSIPCALCVCLGLLQGCSQEVVKRTAYETLQNVREQACQKDMTGECEDRQRYDDYQRQRQGARIRD